MTPRSGAQEEQGCRPTQGSSLGSQQLRRSFPLGSIISYTTTPLVHNSKHGSGPNYNTEVLTRVWWPVCTTLATVSMLRSPPHSPACSLCRCLASIPGIQAAIYKLPVSVTACPIYELQLTKRPSTRPMLDQFLSTDQKWRRTIVDNAPMNLKLVFSFTSRIICS